MYIVLDVNSGGVHVVDELAYKLLDHISPPLAKDCPEQAITALSGEFSQQDIREVYSELYELYEQKILFSGDDYEKYALTAVASPIKALCLLVALDCNLRC